ncbi:MerR family transcriptional regulator [Actinophytocola sediminis]
MRIAELSRRAAVAVPTIKYYVREGLLPVGERTGPNQVSYTEAHVGRLRLVRALVEVGGMSVSAVRAVLAAVDEPDVSLHKVLGAVSNSLDPLVEPAADDPAWAAARARIEGLLDRRGWRVGHDHPAVDTLAGLVVTLDRLGHDEFTAIFDTYAAACEVVAEADVDWATRSASVDEALESVVVGTVLGEAALAALRRLAHAHVSRRLSESPAESSGPGDEVEDHCAGYASDVEASRGERDGRSVQPNQELHAQPQRAAADGQGAERGEGSAQP